jgi:hypothetical protein
VIQSVLDGNGELGGLPVAGETLKVTLVRTDPAGAALQNDLDLIVKTRTAENSTAMSRRGPLALTAATMLSKSSLPISSPGPRRSRRAPLARSRRKHTHW